MVVVSDEAASIAFRRRTDRQKKIVVKAGPAIDLWQMIEFMVNYELYEVRYE